VVALPDSGVAGDIEDSIALVALLFFLKRILRS